jgi:rubredoxin
VPFVAMEEVCVIIFDHLIIRTKYCIVLMSSPLLFHQSVLICCDFCSNAYHARCIGTKVDSLPDPWHCPRCRARKTNGRKDRTVKSVHTDDSNRVSDRPAMRQNSVRSNLSGQWHSFLLCHIIFVRVLILHLITAAKILSHFPKKLNPK